MSAVTSSIRPLGACVALALALAAGQPSAARATTGPGYLLRPPHHQVPATVQARYPGQYVMRTVDRGARIRSSAMFIEQSDQGFLVGGVQFYGYDSGGRQTSWVGTLYDFRDVGGVMHIAVVGPGGAPVLARFALRRGRHGDLAGSVTLDGRRWSIALRRLSGAAPPKQTVALPAPAPKPRPGWGSPLSAYLGRYRAAPPSGGQADGIFGAVLQFGRAITGMAAGPAAPLADQGELTVFMRTVKKGTPPVPSGIVSLHGGGATDVLYLTELQHAGERRTATVTGGSFDGPKVGGFAATGATSGALDAVLTLHGGTKLRLHLVRFSANPHP